MGFSVSVGTPRQKHGREGQRAQALTLRRGGTRRKGRLLWTLALATVAVLGLACQDIPATIPNTLEYPVATSIICEGPSGAYSNQGPCVADGGHYLAVVLDLALAEFKAIDLAEGAYLDRTQTIPGYNGWYFDGVPRDLVAVDGTRELIAAVARPDRLVRYGLNNDPAMIGELDASPRAMVMVDAPEGQMLALILDGVPALGLYDTESLIEISELALDHVPDQLIASPLPGILAWTYRDVAMIGWVDLVDREVKQLPFVGPCVDRLDNDEDGLVDALDPDCAHAWSSSEATPEDGEGSELATLGACANGLDDDGDGLLDHEDPGCQGSNGDAEDADALFCGDGSEGGTCGTLLYTYPCADGIDNDGDGLTDVDEDPDCSSPLGTAEDSSSRLAARAIGFLPDGQHLVVADGSAGALFLVELASSEVLEPLTTPIIQRFEHVAGLQLPAGVNEIAVATTDVQAPADAAVDAAAETASPGVPIYTLTSDGLIYRVRASEQEPATPADGAEPAGAASLALEILEVEEPVETTVGKPLLRVGDESVELGLTSPFPYPGFGAMEISPNGEDLPSTYYGITPSSERLQVRAEAWTLEYEGEIPGSRSRQGALDREAGALIDPSADFCELGVEAGDWLELEFPNLEEDCLKQLGRAWELQVTGVSKDRLTVDFAELSAVALSTADEAAETSDALAEADGELTGRCGTSGVSYRIRVADVFMVLGSRSGFLHNWTSDRGVCVEREDADPRFTARARVARPLSETLEVESCPSINDDTNYETWPFKNLAFSLTLWPGCERLESQLFRPVAPVRDLRWGFQVSGGLQARWISTGGLPSDMQWIDELTALFLADPARGAAYLIEDSADGASAGSVYY